MQAYHTHTFDSNVMVIDSLVDYEQYAIKAKELGYGILASTQHGWQGRYYDAYEVAKKYGLKFIFGTEAYWVRDATRSDRTNAHIILLAKNEKGRRAINKALSEANMNTYYYQPRLGISDILKLPPDDVFVTTACVAFDKYSANVEKYLETNNVKQLCEMGCIETIKDELIAKNNEIVPFDVEQFILQLKGHFKENFYLEIQCHNTEKQKKWNKKLKIYSMKYDIPLILGTDSHYVNESDGRYRELFSYAKEKKEEDDEDQWYMDYPSVEEIKKRMEVQGVFTPDEVQEAIDNTDIILDFEDIEFDKSLKLPIYKGHKDLTIDERFKIYEKLTYENWERYKKTLPAGTDFESYEKDIAYEISIVRDTKMCDYFLIDNKIVELAKQKGGMITKSGRGCFTKESLVQTLNGLKSIKNVNVGDFVVDKNGNFQKVLETFRYHIEEELIRINHFGCGDLNKNICTLDHKILVRSQNNQIDWKPAKDLTKNDYVCVPKMKKKYEIKRYIDLQDYNTDGFEFDDKYIYEPECRIKRYIKNDSKHNFLLGKLFCDSLSTQNETKRELSEKYPFYSKVFWDGYIKSVSNFEQSMLYQSDNNLIWFMSGISYSMKTLKTIGIYKLIQLYYHNQLVETFNHFKFKLINADLEDDKYFYLPITSIEHLPKQKMDVYDLCVESTHSFLINNMIVHNSGASFLTNTLLGFSEFDRRNSPIKIYPERFMSVERILETHSLPDLDLNLGNPEVFEEAQKDILGESHAYPMIAFGTMKKKASWALYAKSQDIPYQTSLEISKQLSEYDNALKYVEEDDKDLIVLEDYVDAKYLSLVNQSEIFNGVIVDKKKAPCAYLIYDGDIASEIGLIRCKSETTKKECITTVIDGRIAEDYKFLKNDLLKVDVVYLIEKIFQKIGIPSFDVNTLIRLVENNQKVWDIYHKGCTLGVNQVEKASTVKKLKRYKPISFAELTAFIAAIRPSFKSMYDKFERREPFSYGIEALDKLLQTKQFPYSYILYQEQIMNILNYAGFPIGQCYSIIKAISKKKPKIVMKLKQQFLESMTKNTNSEQIALDCWQIVDDSTGYGFNSSHAACMCIDSLYMAYLKSHYPLEFYQVMLETYSNKGKKDKVMACISEMRQFFNIDVSDFKFGVDNTQYTIDYQNRKINPSLLGIKTLGLKTVKALYSISQEKKYDNFYDVCSTLKETGIVNQAQMRILINIDYFSDFGEMQSLLKYYKYFQKLYSKKQFYKDDESISPYLMNIIKKHSKETDRLYGKLDDRAALIDLCDSIKKGETYSLLKARNEFIYLGDVKTVDPKAEGVCIITELETTYSPKIQYYSLRLGKYYRAKVSKKYFADNSFKVGDIIEVYSHTKKQEQRRLENGKFEAIPNSFCIWFTDYSILIE